MFRYGYQNSFVTKIEKNTYLLLVFDVHTRRLLKTFFKNIKKYHVITLLSEWFKNYDYPNKMVIQNDNGS